MRYIPVDVLNGKFSFSFSELCGYYNIREDICFIDSFTQDQFYQTPFDYISNIQLNPDVEEVEGRQVTLNFDCNCNYADKMDLALLKKFHYTWFNEMRDFLRGEDFKKILSLVSQVRKKEDVFPKQDLMFSEFLVNLNKVKGVWIGESPYPRYEDANGRAFSTWDKKIPKSLKILIDGIREDLGVSKYDVKNDLVELSSRGVFFLNYCLAIDKDKKLIDVFLPFIQEVIKVLNKKENLSVICFGNYAKKTLPLFKNSFNLYSTSHPVSALYSDKKWETNGVFKNFNKHLNININE